METLVVPAIIAKTQSELNGMLDKVREKIKRVQLDVMDGEFVPNTSMNFDFKLSAGFEYEAHLMVKKPLPYKLLVRITDSTSKQMILPKYFRN